MGNRASVVQVVPNGYNTNQPPADDCCPICFGTFKVPCKTNCGHWYCANCMLELWRHTGKTQPCKCPLCSSIVAKITPCSQQLVQQGVGVRKILRRVRKYNRANDDGSQDDDGGLGLFQKVIGVPWLMLSCFLEDDPKMKTFLKDVWIGMHIFVVMLALLHTIFECNFIPGGWITIMGLPNCFYAFMMVYGHWYGQRHRVGRSDEEASDLQLNVIVLIKSMLRSFREENMGMQTNLLWVFTAVCLLTGILTQSYDHYELNFIPGGSFTIGMLPCMFAYVLVFMFMEGAWYRRKQEIMRRSAEENAANWHLQLLFT